MHNKAHHEVHQFKTHVCLVCSYDSWVPMDVRRHVKKFHGDEELERWEKFDWSSFDRSSHVFSSPLVMGKPGKSSRFNNLETNMAESRTQEAVNSEPSLFSRLTQFKDVVNDMTCQFVKKPAANGKLRTCYICRECGKEYLTKNLFINHRLTVHLNMPKMTRICDKCGAQYTTDEGMQNHYRQAHSDECQEICPDCGKAFKTKKMVYVHKRKVHLKDWPKFTCHFCGKTCGNNAQLKIHINARHTENPEKKFVCHVCGKPWLIKGNLKGHITKVHGEEQWKNYLELHNLSK